MTYVEQYDVRIPDDDVAERMARLEKPHRDETVLRYLHFELDMSSGEIGRLFGVARQTVQKVVREFDWEFHRRRGDSHILDKKQRTLGEFSTSEGSRSESPSTDGDKFERTTLEDLI